MVPGTSCHVPDFAPHIHHLIPKARHTADIVNKKTSAAIAEIALSLLMLCEWVAKLSKSAIGQVCTRTLFR
jgi:NAD-dependent SIR2 family protein deacetylase